MMFDAERAQIRVLANWADAQRMDNVRDLLKRAESEIYQHAKLRDRPAETGNYETFRPSCEP